MLTVFKLSAYISHKKRTNNHTPGFGVPHSQFQQNFLYQNIQRGNSTNHGSLEIRPTRPENRLSKVVQSLPEVPVHE